MACTFQAVWHSHRLVWECNTHFKKAKPFNTGPQQELTTMYKTYRGFPNEMGIFAWPLCYYTSPLLQVPELDQELRSEIFTLLYLLLVKSM